MARLCTDRLRLTWLCSRSCCLQCLSCHKQPHHAHCCHQEGLPPAGLCVPQFASAHSRRPDTRDVIPSHSRPTRPSLLPVALPIHLAVTFSVLLQGALDGGLDIPHSEKRYVGYSSEGKSLDEETLKKYILGGHVSDSGCSESIVLRDCRLGLACRMQLHVCLLWGGGVHE